MNTHSHALFSLLSRSLRCRLSIHHLSPVTIFPFEPDIRIMNRRFYRAHRWRNDGAHVIAGPTWNTASACATFSQTMCARSFPISARLPRSGGPTADNNNNPNARHCRSTTQLSGRPSSPVWVFQDERRVWRGAGTWQANAQSGRGSVDTCLFVCARRKSMRYSLQYGNNMRQLRGSLR